ncbi:MAG: family 16 glycoside hydrolase [Phycisphaerales bacterium]
MTRQLASVVSLACGLAVASAALADGPIRTLLITGHNNHNWQYTSRMHEDTLEGSGRFDVDVTDDPHAALSDAVEAKKYQLFVLDYNDSHEPKRWGEEAEKNFVSAVSAGAGVVAIHSANNAFKGWADYEKMLGLMWREGTGHGKFHAFDVIWVDSQHPITAGLGTMTAHPDELYHNLVNSQNATYHLLGQAMSAKENGGTGKNEPMAFTLEFGKGRVFATPLGHVWNGSDEQKASISDPAFKTLLCRGAEWAATGEVTLPVTWYDRSTANTLSIHEKQEGWKLLFDGKTAAGWRGFKKDAFPKEGWTVRDGILVHEAGKGGGDIVTADQYQDFEFACDWKVAKGGNSGIMYRCTEDHTYPWETGPECQILDDANHADGKKAKTRAGTLYDIMPCAFDVSRPAGEWNHARIVVKGSHIQHYLNGFKVVDIDMGSEEFKKAHAASKWPGMPDYGKREKGYIALQDHGDEVMFRNVKIKTLP